MGTFVTSFLAFIFPSVAYLGAVRYHQNAVHGGIQSGLKPNSFLIASAYGQFLLGVLSIVVGLINNVEDIKTG